MMGLSFHRSYSGAGAVTLVPFLLTEGRLANKPPAFQFYAKDWRSSPNVRMMTREERGLYIDLLALAWDSEEPGTIAMTIPQICRELRVYSASLRKFLAKNSASWQQVNGKLIQPKLSLQWDKYKEISEKRQQAGSKSSANAQQL